MIICKGDGGKLVVNPNDGDVIWAGVCSPLLSWCKTNGYLNVSTLEGFFGLDPHDLDLPECTDCPDYQQCCDFLEDDDQLDPMYCTAIDEEATGASIVAKWSTLDEVSRQELFGFGNYDS